MNVVIPPTPPQDLLELVAFWREMDTQVRTLRDTTSMPRDPVTLPDEFDDVVADIWERVESQARAGVRDGRTVVAIVLPRTDDLVALCEWARDRMELLEGLVRSGVVQPSWQRPLALMVDFWRATLEQIDAR